MTAIGRYDDLVRDLMRRPGPVRLVGVDGGAGAGKTTFAARLSAAAAPAGGAPVVHTDDFASHDDFLGWWPRLLDAVVTPLLAGEPASYVAYDWVARGQGKRLHIEPAPIVVIEGVGATRRARRDNLAMSIWIDAPRDERLRRGIERDGEELREFWRQWLAEEDDYVATEDPAGYADLVVDGSGTGATEMTEGFVIVRRKAAAGTPRKQPPAPQPPPPEPMSTRHGRPG